LSSNQSIKAFHYHLSDIRMLPTNQPDLLQLEQNSYAFIVSSSPGSLIVDGEYIKLRTDAPCLIHSGQLVDTQSSDRVESPQRSYFIQFSAYEAMGVAAVSPAVLAQRLGATSVSSETLLELCEEMLRGWSSPEDAGALLAQSCFYKLIYLLLKQPEAIRIAAEQTKLYLEGNLHKDLTIKQLALRVGVDRYSLMKGFKERYGISIMEMLTELRIGRSKELLARQGHTVQEAAHEVGYADAFYFSRQFKKQVGFAPSIFRRNASMKVAAYSWPNMGQLLPLGIIPCAAPVDHAWTDFYRKHYRADLAAPLMHDYDYNLATLERVQPDYIIALNEAVPCEEQARLAHLAPTLFLPWLEDDWRSHLRETARFLDKVKDAERWLDGYEHEANKARISVKQRIGEGSMLAVNVGSDGLSIWGRKVATVLYDDLGIRMPSAEIERINPTADAEPEQLMELDADWILLNIGLDALSVAQWDTIRVSASWQSLMAVRHNRVIYTPNYQWFGSPYLEYNAFHQERFLQELTMCICAK